MNDALNQIAGAYGSFPTATGAQTIFLPVYAFEAEEATTFGSFYDKADNELVFHPWKGKTVAEGKVAFFGQKVHKFTITAGGKGQMFGATDQLPSPVLVSAATTANGLKVNLTFDRPIANPVGLHASVKIFIGAVENPVTALALNADARIVEATLTNAVVFADAVTVEIAYNVLKSGYGAPALPSNTAVTNTVPQIPALVSAATTADGTKVILTYDINMADPAAHKADFALKYSGAAKVINTAALGANIKTIELTPAVAAVNADVVTLSMTAGNIKGATGGIAAALVNQAVVNNVPA